MGLELVELVLDVEDTFGFSIADEDTASLTTVGKLYDYVLAHRFREKQDACLTSIAFYKVRRALMSVLDLPRDAVRVSTDLAAIFPRRRRRTWRAIERATGCRLPFLRRPPWVVRLATVAALGLGFAVPYSLGLKPLGGGVLVGLLSAFASAFPLAWVTELLAVRLPPDVATVGQLAKAIVARNYQPLVAESRQSANDAEVWDTLRRIVAEQFGIRPDQVTRETSFVKDLVAG
ncbi:MAG: hypothetical protein ABFC63_10505 [Thermoguttaceae bacterium]